jgi:arsenate reductase (thioredoxin)
MKNVLILCTGNSCRSIMAEVLMRDLGGGRYSSFSAGSKPSGRVNAKAAALLAAKGHNVSGLRSKSWDEFSGPLAPTMDYVFTVCGNAASETCPIWMGAPLQAHWGVDDPSDVKGTAAEIDAAYELAYDRLKRRVEAFLALPVGGMTQASLSAIGRIED